MEYTIILLLYIETAAKILQVINYTNIVSQITTVILSKLMFACLLYNISLFITH